MAHLLYLQLYFLFSLSFNPSSSSPRRLMASKAHESGSRHHESRRSSTDSRYHDRQPSSKSSHSKHHDSQHSSRSGSLKHHESQHSSRSDTSRHHVTQHSSRSNGSKEHHESQHSSRSSASRHHESQHSSRLGGSKHYESQHSSRPDSSRHHESQYSSQHSSRPGGSRYHESQHSSRHHDSQYSSMRHHQEGQYSSRYHENQNSSRVSSSKQHQNPQSSSLSRLPILPSSFRSYSSVLQGSHSSSSSIKKDSVITKKQIVLPDRFHEHALTMMSAAREPYRCSGCKEQGFGRSYRCENKGCRYVLHEECANAVVHRKNHVSHSFFEGQEFWFLEKPLGYPRVCDACRMDVRGFVYHRNATKDVYDTGLDLHPSCLKLSHKIPYNDSNATKTLTLRRHVEKKCVKCKSRKVGDDSKVKGWSYLTSDGDCFHVSCFKELFLEKIRDDYFSEKKIVVSKMQSNVVDSNMKVVKVEGGSSNNSKGSSSLAKIVVVKIAPVVLKLIFSAIFGNPVSFVLALVEALVTSFN